MMITGEIWLLKLVVAHLLTDFVLQPKSWIEDRNKRHYLSSRLYLHGLITGMVALLFVGYQYWLVILVIMLSHTIIDGWKSYRPQNLTWFSVDQLMHFIVILGCWYFTFLPRMELSNALQQIGVKHTFWAYAASIIFLTAPAGILIGQMTMKWREKISGAESLANAGKWIGIIERIIVFILVMLGQYSAISLLIAAKGIIRFNEKDRPEVKTEYLVIGTLLSIGIAMVTGIALRHLL